MKNFIVVISGSFRKHFSGIQEKIGEFEAAGIDVLSPKKAGVKNPGEEFAILETDDTNDPKTFETRHLDAIEAADALYLYNPDGYIGASAALELGYALALGKPIFSKEPGEDFTLKLFSGIVANPGEIAKKLREINCHPLETINPRSSLGALQKCSRAITAQRDFSKETPTEIMLLLVEEVGELAKAIRKFTNLKIDVAKADKYPLLQDEFGDVLIYLLHLANSLGVSLFTAISEKERKNERRFWDKAETESLKTGSRK